MLTLRRRAVNRCGTSYSNASTKCNKCPRGIDGECPAGETCYAGLPDCTSGSTPPPTAPTPPGSCVRLLPLALQQSHKLLHHRHVVDHNAH